MKRWLVGVVCALFAWTAWANSSDVRKTAEATMLVTGWIEVAPEGSVHGYTIDHPEKIPPVVADLIQKSVPGWKFHFVEHVDAIQKARMNLRIVAKQADDQHDSIAISGATFGDANAQATDHVTYKDWQGPAYPHEAIEAHVSGTVFLLMRVNREGRVEDIAVEQVNLGVYGREAQIRQFRRLLGNAALVAARNWTFNLPTTGKHVMDSYWDVRVPVNFDVRPSGLPEDTYGKWEPYIPGPRELIPWSKSDARLSSTSDAIPADGISPADQPLQLTITLGGT